MKQSKTTFFFDLATNFYFFLVLQPTALKQKSRVIKGSTRPKPTQIFFFGLVSKSPTHRGLIYVKKSALDLVMLGPFNVNYLCFALIFTFFNINMIASLRNRFSNYGRCRFLSGLIKTCSLRFEINFQTIERVRFALIFKFSNINLFALQ